MVTPILTLGQHIRERRKELGLSLRECAGRLNISPQFLSDIELGRRYPSEKVLFRIATAIGTTVENFRRYDTRVPFDQLRQMAAKDPALSRALRMLVSGAITGHMIIDLVNDNDYRELEEAKRNKTNEKGVE